MKHYKKLLAALFALLLTSCATTEEYTEEDLKKMNKADAFVAGVLFEDGLDTTASYNIRKSGFVAIQFADTVPEKQYTKTVATLRSSPLLFGVRAEKGGEEVCGEMAR